MSYKIDEVMKFLSLGGRLWYSKNQNCLDSSEYFLLKTCFCSTCVAHFHWIFPEQFNH